MEGEADLMNYIDEIFARAHIQQIREFLLNGMEEMDVDPRPYKQRLESTQNILMAQLHTDYPDKEDFEKISELVYCYAGTVEEVYMEIGLQVGTLLAVQIGQNIGLLK